MSEGVRRGGREGERGEGGSQGGEREGSGGEVGVRMG